MKKILFSTILLLFLNNANGQLKLSINVYKDSTLSSYLSDVKIDIISIDKKKTCFKIKSAGEYVILMNNLKSEYFIEIKKKRFIPIILNIKPKVNNEYVIKVILRKAFSIHDKENEGPSKIISIKKLD